MALKPCEYIAPVKTEIAAHLDVRDRVSTADTGTIAGLFVYPRRFDLETLGQLFGGEYVFHRWVITLLVCNRCANCGKA
jgi:hypothetical protein